VCSSGFGFLNTLHFLQSGPCRLRAFVFSAPAHEQRDSAFDFSTALSFLLVRSVRSAGPARFPLDAVHEPKRVPHLGSLVELLPPATDSPSSVVVLLAHASRSIFMYSFSSGTGFVSTSVSPRLRTVSASISYPRAQVFT
jgi:hypothetical protein